MSEINRKRRSILKGVAITGAVASVPLSASAAIKPIADGLERGEFLMPDFKSIEGQSVAVRCSDGVKHQAEVVEVSDMPFACQTHARPGHLRSCAKVVRFKVSDAGAFSNDVYQVTHSELGKMDLLMTVVPDASGELALEAVFN